MLVQADENSPPNRRKCTMQQTDSKKSLDPLPPNDNKEFWGDAEMHGNIIPQKVAFFDQPHFFIRVTGHEAQCTHCDWGFALDPGDKVKEGHLYDKNGDLVI